MIIKIGGMLCVLVLIGVRSQDHRDCRPRYKNDESQMKYSYEKEYCEVLASEVNEQTWYQSEAFLKLIRGTFTVELLSDNSAPISLNVEGKGVVRLNKDFAKISSLERLSLEDNLIEGIESSVFAGLPGLIYLSLARNRIKHISKDSFQGLSKLEILNLNHNALTTITEFSLSDDKLPALTQLYLQHNRLKNVEDLCNSNLAHLYLSNNALSSFTPDYLPSEKPCLKNLTHLFLEDNKIRDFSIGKMRLEALSLDGNRLIRIPQTNSYLKFLSLARNRIEYLYNLHYAVNIVRLILSYNHIRIHSRGDEKVHNFSSLEHLALDHNFLTTIPEGFFRNVTSLGSLYLTDNNIETISPKAFGDVPALQELSFANNKLKSFPGKESFGKSNIRYLDFSNNKVENISDLQVNMIPKLRVLKLGGNPLKRMDPLCSNITIWF